MKLLLSLLLLLSLDSFANVTDDSDLSTPVMLEDWKGFDTDFFRPDSVVEEELGRGQLQIKLLLDKNGLIKELTGLTWEIRVAKTTVQYNMSEGIQSLAVCQKNPGAEIQGIALLGTSYYEIQNHKGQPYELMFDGHCGKINKLIFKHDTFSGQGMGVWDIGYTAVQKLGAINRLDFWSHKIDIVWPATGDYYNWNTVNVTKGYQWDVVGHELGHAIYDQADIGSFGGGQHFIDRCYRNALALSEGWASFFSAWLSVSLDNPDAKFEYMVPRRAPLHIETVPDDVCKGPTNEWRVYSFLWDLIDTNNDGEALDIKFQQLWDATLKQNFSSIEKLKSKLDSDGFDPVLLNVIWKQTIMGETN